MTSFLCVTKTTYTLRNITHTSFSSTHYLYIYYPSQTVHTQQLLPPEVHHCVSSLRQYRACVVDFLGVGIMYVYYIIVLAMCRSHPDLVSFAFSAIPIFYILICTCIGMERRQDLDELYTSRLKQLDKNAENTLHWTRMRKTHNSRPTPSNIAYQQDYVFLHTIVKIATAATAQYALLTVS